MKNEILFAAIEALQQTHADFKASKLSPLEHSRQREAAITLALEQVALEHGVTLQTPLHIDSRGEYSVVALRPDGRNPAHYGSGLFVNGFNELLNAYNPRCGVSAGATLLPENGWCRLNHFDAERLVVAFCERQAEVSEPAQKPVG